MERRKAVIAAATASLTLLAGAAAISLNTSLVGASGDDGVGHVSPVDPATTPSTIFVDEPAAGRTTSPSPSRDGEFDDEDEFERDEADGFEDDSHGDDGTYEDDDHEYDDHEYDDHEYEGADDDD
jgi:hypothetical protein